MKTESAPQMFPSKRNHERCQWPLQYTCQTCYGAATAMEGGGEEVATPENLCFWLLVSTFSSLVQFFVTRDYMSRAIVSVMWRSGASSTYFQHSRKNQSHHQKRFSLTN